VRDSPGDRTAARYRCRSFLWNASGAESGPARRSNLGENHEQYLAAIDHALAEDSPELRRRRMNAVAGASWDARFHETVAVVDKLL